MTLHKNIFSPLAIRKGKIKNKMIEHFQISGKGKIMR